jgi:peptide/nickel transport system substrate-binding protein
MPPWGFLLDKLVGRFAHSRSIGRKQKGEAVVSIAVKSSRRGRQVGALAACALGSLLAAKAALAYQEAPMLAERVTAGELPPVDERLPAEPLVVTPIEETGTYGGTLRRVLIGSSGDHNTILRIVGPQSLVRWKPDYSGLEPNLATSWEISDDARAYTFHLREGLKWSDGHPLTTEDIRFFVDDILNSDFYGSPRSSSSVAARPSRSISRTTTL